MIPKISAKIMSVSTLPHEHPGVFVTTRGTIVAKMQNKTTSIFSTKKLGLVGKHNWENAVAAVGCALVTGVKRATIGHVLASFMGLPHRLELIREVDGVKYYNDSFATTPETTIAAICSFDAPKVLILGGSTKAADFTELAKIITQANSVRAIIGIDPEWPRIKAAIGKLPRKILVVEGCKSMGEIIGKTQEVSQAGDVVLLSPGCASFGMFKNYKDRGNQFKEVVLAI
jgi:UDP-N-acetylmuramoylalanine--D-glutamate ligase